MSLTLYAMELRRGLASFVAIMAVIIMYVVSVIYMYDPETTESLGRIMEAMPEAFAVFGMANLATTMTDFLLNYLYGALLTWMPLLLVMMVVNRMLVRPVERGSLAYVLALPLGRARIAATLAAVVLTILVAAMVLVAVVQLGFSESLFPGELDRAAVLRANAGLLCLWVFMAGSCFASACALRDTRAALFVAGAVAFCRRDFNV